MKKEIAFENQTVTYTLRKNRRSQRIHLAVYPDGRAVVTTPFHIGESYAERFIQDKSVWLLSKIDFFKRFKLQPTMRHSRADYLKHKEAAHALIRGRIEYFNQIYQFRFGRIAVKNQRTCWGSCSRKANLNFNYKITLLPSHLADYVIVHELCHLAEFNHSRKFWGLVAKVIPNPLEKRRELKKTGMPA